MRLNVALYRVMAYVTGVVLALVAFPLARSTGRRQTCLA